MNMWFSPDGPGLQPPAEGGPCNPLMLLYLVLNETFDFQTQESSEDLTMSPL